MATQPRGSGQGGSSRRGARVNWKPVVIVFAIGMVLFAAGAAIRLWPKGPDPLRVYSSLPQRERLESGSTGGSSTSVVRNERTADMENAIRLALAEAGGKANDRDVIYQPLDDSDDSGDSPAAVVQDNARRAAADPDTAIYIGEFTSDATQESLPILSRARVPQISVSSTRVGLTRRDPGLSDRNEPARYYPPQRNYPNGYRNFVRLIPTTAVHAQALLALMAQVDHCSLVAMINDDSSYGRALASDMIARNHGRVKFAFNQSVGSDGSYWRLVEQAHRRGADCFVYSGIRNPNTVEIFAAFARVLPAMTLYGSNGLVTASFVDPRKGGLSPTVAAKVKIMVPPYDPAQAQGFFDRFRKAYHKTADTYALYAYEAMQLGLAAIDDSETGRRDGIVRALFPRNRPGSPLGDYSITSTGDTDVASYGVSSIAGGRMTPPTPAPQLRMAQ